jgi:16S rRNA processing protein RimM
VDYPEDYSNLESVYIENNGKLIPFFLEEIEILPKGFARVKLEDVDSIEDSQKLIKGQLFLPIENLPTLNEDQFYFHEIIDYRVIDELLGDVGSIIEYLDMPINPQLLVSHKGKEVLIPINEHFYKGVNKSKKELYVSLPPGLIEVNLG